MMFGSVAEIRMDAFRKQVTSAKIDINQSDMQEE
jgi:hypothetical protein